MAVVAKERFEVHLATFVENELAFANELRFIAGRRQGVAADECGGVEQAATGVRRPG
jgi:hypothetical protein